MKKNIYIIRDFEAEELLPPFYANNDESALRMVKNSIKSHQFKNMNLEEISLFRITILNLQDDGLLTTEENKVTLIANLDTLVDSEINNRWDNEALAQSITKCFEMAITKFLSDNKKE